MNLFIAEKPDLAKAICAALDGNVKRGKNYHVVGNNYVTWCYGHMLELNEPEDTDPKYKKWKFSDLPVFWPLSYKPRENSKEQLDSILELINDSDVKQIVNAGDPDDEGQLLIDEILDYANNKKPVKRVLINDNTTSLVKKAIAKMDDNSNYLNLYKSALARQIADKFYGYNMTRAYTLEKQANGGKGVVRVGRVQTVILWLVVNRERLIESHKSSYYYTLEANVLANGLNLDFSFIPPDNFDKDHKGRCVDKKSIDQINANIANEKPVLDSLEIEDKESSAPLPFNLIYLQAAASDLFNMASDKTLSVTQSLRDKHKLITYNRSDCQYLSDEQHSEAGSVVNAVLNNLPDLVDFAMSADVSIKSRAFNSKNVSAHHAIIPTQNKVDNSKLTKDEKNIYFLIARAYLAQFQENKKYKYFSLTISIYGHKFRFSKNITTTKGWEALYPSNSEAEISGNIDKKLLDAIESESFNDFELVSSEVKRRKTTPPKHYTNSTLLLELTKITPYIESQELRDVLIARDKDKKGEHGSIGTPATRSNMIKAIFDQELVINKSKKVRATDKGFDVIDNLLPASKRPDMTAQWQKYMNDIQSGNIEITDFIHTVCMNITSDIEAISKRSRLR